MAEAKQSENDILTCSICLDVFTEPKILPCVHRFCESCLNNYITRSVPETTSEQRGFPCPCCRAFTPGQNPSRPLAEWAAQFKTDFVIKELINLKSRKLPEIKYSCPTHKDIEYDYYCVDCCSIACHRCALASHRGCKQVIPLTNAINDRKLMLRLVIEKMMTQLEQANKSESAYVKWKDEIESERNKAAEEIKACGEELRKLVTDEESKLLGQLNTGRDTRSEKGNSAGLKVREIKDQIEGRINTVLSKLSLSDMDMMLDNSVVDIISMCLQCDLSKAVESMNRLCENLCRVGFIFQKASPPSMCLGSVLILLQAKEGTFLKHASQLNNGSPDVQPISGKTPDRQHQVQVLRTIDTTCGDNIADVGDFILVTPGSTIIVTDYQNKCVKTFCSTGAANMSLKLKSEPWGITQISDILAAVSLPCSKHICLIQITPSLKVKSYNKSSKSYMSLATLDNTMLVAARHTPSSCIDIITHKGQHSMTSPPIFSSTYAPLPRHGLARKITAPSRGDSLAVVKSFSNKSNSDIPEMVSTPFLRVTPDKFILASCCVHKRLLCLSQDGTTKFKYLQENVRGVACTSSGRIFLLASNSLLTLTPDGQPDKILIRSNDRALLCRMGMQVDSEGLVYIVNNSYQMEVFKITGFPYAK